MAHFLTVVQGYIQHHGYWAVFGIILLESFGAPLPGETVLIAAAILAAQGKVAIVPVLLAAWAGAVLGDNIGYAIGRFGGRRLILRYGRYIHITENRLHSTESFFRRRGIAIVIVARFVEVLRQLNGIVAGIGGMSWWRFLVCNAVGAVLWVGAWGFGTYHLGHSMRNVHHAIRWVGPGAFAVSLTIGLGAYFLHRRSERRRRSADERCAGTEGEGPPKT